MLDFYLIADEQPNNTPSSQLRRLGGIEEEEFEMAQHLGLIETYADYYGKFRWSSQQVSHKLFLLSSCPMRGSTALQDILQQAQAGGLGLAAWGD
ncbi:hypothetical protein HHL22_05805 [Hymenobacter sp. RP-2-7]|uniref:Uncharacterized protein n=1 Tax=Hymenobacter polaris TaxID=2682546 RepID=A0A7Y0ACB4_9BACT|nr:hypothetical protein [Hymenobacter polaris]NML64716.1 hypothetical protein [Hymenobacter polaris]